MKNSNWGKDKLIGSLAILKSRMVFGNDFISTYIPFVARVLININSEKGTAVYFFHGTAANEMLAKKSAKYVRKHHPNTTVKCFKGKFHCENALFHPEIMIAELDKIFDK